MQGIFPTLFAFLFCSTLYGQPSGFFRSSGFTLQNNMPIGGECNIYASHKDNAGNTWVAGVFMKTCDFDPGANNHSLTSRGGQDLFIAKYNAEGEFVLVRQITNPSRGNPDITGIRTSSSGDIYLTGILYNKANLAPLGSEFELPFSEGDNPYNKDIFLAKYNTQGDLINAFSIGGTGEDQVKDIEVDLAGNIFLTGNFQGTVNFAPDGASSGIITAPSVNTNAFFAKYSPTGSLVYVKHLSSEYRGTAHNLKIGPNNQLVVLGSMDGSMDLNPGPGIFTLNHAGNASNIFIGRYDLDGNFITGFRTGTNSYGGWVSDKFDFDINPSGEIIVTGGFGGNVDFGTGNVWGEKLLSGSSSSSQNAFIATFSPQGQCQNALALQSNQIISSNNIIYLKNGEWLLTGIQSGVTDFDPTSGAYNIGTPTNQNAFFLARYSSNGVPSYVRIIQTTQYGYFAETVIDQSDNIEITGNYRNSIDFNPAPALAIKQSTYSNGFVASYSLGSGSLLKYGTIGNNNTGRLDDKVQLMSADYNSGIYLGGSYQEVLSIGIPPDTTKIKPPVNYPYFDGSPNFIAAYNSNGDLKYGLNFGSFLGVRIRGFNADSTGNLYVNGSFNRAFDIAPGPDSFLLAPFGTNHDLFSLKYSPEGNLIYGKKMGNSTGSQMAEFTAFNKKGSQVMIGIYTDSFDIDPGPGEKILLPPKVYEPYFVAKFDPSGNLVYGFDFAADNIRICKAALDAYENLYVLVNIAYGTVDIDPGPGKFEITTDFPSLYLVKYDKNGDFVTARKIADLQPNIQNYYELMVSTTLKTDIAGNLYLGGTFRGTLELIADGGNFQQTSSMDLGDLFIAKYNENLVFQSGFKIGGEGVESLRDFAIGPDNQLYFTGTISGTSVFNIAGTTKTLISDPGIDIFFASTSNNGNLLSIEALQSNIDAEVSGLALSGKGNIVLAGSFENLLQTDPQKTRSGLLNGYNGLDIFFATYKQCGGTLTTTKAGSWHDPSIWASGSVPGPNDCVYVKHIVSVTQHIEIKALQLSDGGELNVAPGIQVIIND